MMMMTASLTESLAAAPSGLDRILGGRRRVTITGVLLVLAMIWGVGCGDRSEPGKEPAAPARVAKNVVIIHGVGNHAAGYSTPFQTLVNVEVREIHFSEVLWSDLGSLLRQLTTPDKDIEAAEQGWLGEIAAAEKRTLALRSPETDEAHVKEEYTAARGYLGPIVRYELLPRAERLKIQQRFREALDWAGQHADQTYVVAHSLGSVIAFDVLHAWEGGAAPSHVALLCTMGSPLGNRLFLNRRGRPATRPAAVDAWVNFYSATDPISSALEGAYADVQDSRVQTSVLPIAAHSSYWTHQDLIAQLLPKIR